MSKIISYILKLYPIIIVISVSYLTKVYIFRYSRQAINRDKWATGSLYKKHPLYGEDAIKLSRSIARMTDVIFWFLSITILIITVYDLCIGSSIF